MVVAASTADVWTAIGAISSAVAAIVAVGVAVWAAKQSKLTHERENAREVKEDAREAREDAHRRAELERQRRAQAVLVNAWREPHPQASDRTVVKVHNRSDRPVRRVIVEWEPNRYEPNVPDEINVWFEDVDGMEWLNERGTLVDGRDRRPVAATEYEQYPRELRQVGLLDAQQVLDVTDPLPEPWRLGL